VNRRYLILGIMLLVLGLAPAGCGGDDDDGGEAAGTTEASTTSGTSGGGTTLNGSVGPGFDISLDGTDGITAGDYTLVVNDQSSAHNFHLTGPGGVDVSTEVSAEGEESFDVTLQAGEYTFVCDPHASQMNGSFTVG
jgi:plastocyanin